MRAVKGDFSIFPPSFDLMSRRGATLCITSKLGPLNTWIEVYHRVMNTGNADAASPRGSIWTADLQRMAIPGMKRLPARYEHGTPWPSWYGLDTASEVVVYANYGTRDVKPLAIGVILPEGSSSLAMIPSSASSK